MAADHDKKTLLKIVLHFRYPQSVPEKSVYVNQ